MKQVMIYDEDNLCEAVNNIPDELYRLGENDNSILWNHLAVVTQMVTPTEDPQLEHLYYQALALRLQLTAINDERKNF